MKNKRNIIILSVIVVLLILYVILRPEIKKLTVPKPQENLCFYSENTNEGGLKSVVDLKISVFADKSVVGSLDLVPAGQEALKGDFIGNIEMFDEGRIANVIYVYGNDEKKTKEEKVIVISNDTASIGFGEMIPGENDIYVYKDRNKLAFSASFPHVPCKK